MNRLYRTSFVLLIGLLCILTAACGQDGRTDGAAINTGNADPRLMATLEAELERLLALPEAKRPSAWQPQTFTPEVVVPGDYSFQSRVEWEYYFPGDYNQDGRVSIYDLTTL